MNKIFSDKFNAECVSSLDPSINIVIGTAEDFTMEKSSEDSPSEDVQSEEEVNDKERNDFEKCLNDIANPLKSSAHTNTTIMFKESGLTVNEVVTLVAGLLFAIWCFYQRAKKFNGSFNNLCRTDI